MLSKRKHRVFRTVTFRLTLQYAVLFGILSVAGFTLEYSNFSSNLKRQLDSELSNDIIEFKTIYIQHGLKGLQDEFNREAEANGINRVFFRLLTPEGKVLASSNLTTWLKMKELFVASNFIDDIQGPIRTLSFPGHHYGVRVMTKNIQDGNFLQIGKTMSFSNKLLHEFKSTSITLLVIMISCGVFIGLLISKQAMTGVQRVSRAAFQVGKGNLELRVPVENQGQEIEDLAYAFNDMLERIQVLVKELKEMTNSVAHDLRSPITRIRGLAESTLLEDKSIEDYRDMASVVVEESDRLVEMVNAMLEIAQVNSGVLKFDVVPKVMDDWSMI